VRTMPRAQWVEYLSQLDVCFGELNTLPEALRDPHLIARGMVLTDELGRRHLNSPIRFEREPARPDLHEPAMGEHGARILGQR